MKKVVIVLVALIAVLAGFVATRPDSFKVERTQTIQAPADVVFARVADFHQWSSWSPWAKKDPAMKVTYEGVPGQVGSSYAWSGNDDVGAGKMTILEAKAPQSLKIQLDFLKPMKITHQVEFHFTAAPPNTTVSWVMNGHNTFLGKAFTLVMDMDKMIGPDFELGLSQLKSVSEAEARRLAAAAAAAAAAPAQQAAPPTGEAAPAPTNPTPATPHGAEAAAAQ